MFHRQSTLNRGNTYLPREFFKVIVLASTKEKSELSAQWLTGTMTSNRGVYGCAYNKSQMIVFSRWPEVGEKQASTMAVEAVIIFVDNLEEFQKIKPEVTRYGAIPIRVLVSKDKNLAANSYSDQIKAYFFNKESDSKSLKEKLDEWDKEELKKIKNIFQTYDVDGSGFIDANEMANIATSMGEDPKTDNFKLSMLALDFNSDNTISFTEFISWWKIGRQNILTLPKIYALNTNSKDIVTKTFNFPDYVRDISEVVKNHDTKTTQKINFKSPGIFRLKSFVEFGLAIGGSMKSQMAVDFLKQFTSNTSITKNNWISILLTLNPNQKSVDPYKAKHLLEEFKDSMIRWGEEHANPVLISFIKNLMLFETCCTEKTVVLVCRLKLDIEELVKGAIHQFLFILGNLSEKNESFWINGKAHSNVDLFEEAKNEKLTLSDILKVSEFKFEGAGFRNRLKTLFNSLKPELRNKLGLLQFLFQPFNLEVDYEGDLNELVDEDSKQLLNSPLSYSCFVINFLKQNLSSELLAAANFIELGVNAFDVFFKLKLYSKSVFNHDIKKDI